LSPLQYSPPECGEDTLVTVAKKKDIPYQFFPKGTWTVDEDIQHKLFLSNEDGFKEEIDDLNLEEVFEDCIL
jgi:hypothetical protein